MLGHRLSEASQRITYIIPIEQADSFGRKRPLAYLILLSLLWRNRLSVVSFDEKPVSFQYVIRFLGLYLLPLHHIPYHLDKVQGDGILTHTVAEKLLHE